MEAKSIGRRGALAHASSLCLALTLAFAFSPGSALAAARVPAAGPGFLGPVGAGALLSLPSGRSSAEPAEPVVLVDPALPDAWHGWRRTPTSVRVVAPGRSVLYRWDADLGPWRRVAGEVVVPEGRHVLHLAVLSSDGGGRGRALLWNRDVELKVSFPSPPLRPAAPASRMTAAALLSDSQSVRVKLTVAPIAGPTIERLGGRDRYETAALVSRSSFSSARVVILATGQDFADALSSSGLAGSYGAPLLLTRRDVLPNYALSEMKRLGAGTCIITGGTAAVSKAVAASVAKAGLQVQRLGGSDRYATAALIAGEIEKRQGRASLGFLARGDDFPDALAVSPFAYASRSPILLTRPASMPAPTRAFLARGYMSRLVIAGGTVAVSRGVEAEAAAYAGDVSRAGGSDRYATAALAAKTGEELGLTKGAMVGVATGANFPDALCGGIAAGHRGGCILLTRTSDVPSPTGRTLSDYGPYLRLVQVYGGTAVVDESVMETLRTIIQ